MEGSQVARVFSLRMTRSLNVYRVDAQEEADALERFGAANELATAGLHARVSTRYDVAEKLFLCVSARDRSDHGADGSLAASRLHAATRFGGSILGAGGLGLFRRRLG